MYISITYLPLSHIPTLYYTHCILYYTILYTDARPYGEPSFEAVRAALRLGRPGLPDTGHAAGVRVVYMYVYVCMFMWCVYV